MQNMISILQSFTKSSHIYTNHSNTSRYTVVQTRVMGFRKEFVFLGVLIREGFPKEESFISLHDIGPDLICGVPGVPKT